ncbi:hypothetical protein BLNAU_22167 [Blattamonas nauphoetae]|uniref:Uncharacterized protein n=1 Tax=Blattamonas nauphoetae TaxID=2049346 RepID=A0ABQ9WTS4_9EUKA|nr:hypothetical protein BLNAU_22167 [Blattamonas nauphoetae]
MLSDEAQVSDSKKDGSQQIGRKKFVLLRPDHADNPILHDDRACSDDDQSRHFWEWMGQATRSGLKCDPNVGFLVTSDPPSTPTERKAEWKRATQAEMEASGGGNL